MKYVKTPFTISDGVYGSTTLIIVKVKKGVALDSVHHTPPPPPPPKKKKKKKKQQKKKKKKQTPKQKKKKPFN